VEEPADACMAAWGVRRQGGAVSIAWRSTKTDQACCVSRILGAAAVFALTMAVVAPPLAAAAGVKLRLSDWHLQEPHWERSLRAMTGVFQTQNPGISVTLEPVAYAEKERQYTAEIQAGGGPDLIHLHGFSIRSFMEKGFLLDVTAYARQEGKTGWGGSFLDPWYPAALDLMRHGGALYALPSDFMSMVLFYNRRLFAEAGLDPDRPPGKWEEFLQDAKALTRDLDGDGRPDTWGFGTVGAVDPGFELRFTPFLLSFGASYLTPEGARSAFNTKEAREAFRFYVELYARHKVVPPGVTNQNPTGVRRQMAGGQIAMKIGSGWTVPILADMNPALDAAHTLAAAPVPVAAGLNVDKPTTAWISAWMINRNTRHPREAWRLLKFLTSKAADERWFTDARVLSARRDVSGGLEARGIMPFAPILADPFSRVIAKELQRSQLVPQVKEWPQIIEIVNRATQAGFLGARDADDALGDAYDSINRLLSVYRSAGENVPDF
jgi:multiple sugar transport system substrate-binding protein